MYIWRKTQTISWTAHVSKEEVSSLVQEQRSLVHVIKQRQVNWIGHVLRHDCLLKTVVEGKKEGKRHEETKKENVGPTHEAREQEDQLPGVE